ncbi:MAG: nodulation protein NfeD [Bacteroidales bacterium]|jgi:membrane-bound serine protease (ClpP class)|nr:nodulation protein NfeD [Bacteroidales bacterium]
MTCVFLRLKKVLFLCLFGCLALFSLNDLQAADEPAFAEGRGVYVFDIMDEIGPAMWRTTMQSIDRAVQMKATLIIIHMNTYGGLVDAADSIRTKILNCPIPVYVFVDNNAISAGALIAVACDKIYMREGASIGAATVVNQTGEAMPDKYQSFMRSMMRATAMAHGKDTIISGKDTIYRWRRDPNIAQAMVDPAIVVKELVDDSTKLLTMTVEEAISVRYCEGKAASIEDILAANNLSDATVTRHVLTPLEKVIHFLINPYLHSLLIMLIIGGIYFEFQTPGIGFPLAVSVIAALLYFAPLFLEGIANHWELALFIVGLLLIGLEIFALPGFGVAGVSGIILMVLGISLAMVDNIVFEWDWVYGLAALFKSVCLVVVSAAAALGLSIWAGRYFFENTALSRVMLQAVQKSSEGYVSFDDWTYLVGVTGIARSVLRPAGKVEIDGKLFDAVSEIGFINAGDAVKIIRFETGQLYVVRINGKKG